MTTEATEKPISSTQSHYWSLASIDKSVRITAATSLLAALNEFQSNHISLVSSVSIDSCVESFVDVKSLVESIVDVTELTKNLNSIKTPINNLEQLKNSTASDVSYAIKRLIRGLSSSRDGEIKLNNLILGK